MTADLVRRKAVIVTTEAETISISDYAAGGDFVEIIVRDWDEIKSTEIDPTDYSTTPAQCKFTVKNNFEVGSYDRFTDIPGLSGAAITVYQNEQEVFSGFIEQPSGIEDARCVISCIGLDSELTKSFIHEIVNEDDHEDADPDDIGIMLPQVWGSPKRVRFAAIDVGVLTTLKTTISTAASTVDIELTETSALPVSGTIQIGSEKITYSSKNDITKIVSGITRGVLSTTAAAHWAGELVGEVRSEYVYGLGSPANFNAVYVGKVLQDSAEYTTYTGIAGDGHATYPGRAIISFSDLSLILRGGSTAGNVVNYSIARPVQGLPIGHITRIDNHGKVAAFNEETTITFPEAPDGVLSDIYVEYEFDCEQYYLNSIDEPDEYFDSNWIADGIKMYIDGFLVSIFEARQGYHTYYQRFLTDSSYTTVRVKKTSWPTTAEKTKSFFHTHYGFFKLTIVKATVHCTSTVPETDQWGKLISRKAIGLPIGKMLSNTTVDDTDEITFPVAPSGNLNGIYVKIDYEFHKIGATWDYAIYGSDRLYPAQNKPKSYYIGEYPVYHIVQDADYGLNGSNECEAYYSPIYIPFTEWQTSLAKTKSMLAMWGKCEEFIITNAEQFCFTDDFSNDVELSGNSVADSIIGGDVYADVTAVLSLPTDIIKNIIEVKCGKTGVADAVSYAAVRANHVSASFAEAVVIDKKPNVPGLLTEIAIQSKLLQFFWLGKHYVKYMNQSYTPDAVITHDDIVSKRISYKETNKAYITNKFNVSYNKYWNGDEEQNTAVSEDTDSDGSQAVYGTQTKDIKLPFIQNQIQAQAVGDWRLLDFKSPRGMVEYEGHQTNNMNRKIGNIVTFDTTDTNLNNLLAGKVAPGDQFLILLITILQSGRPVISAIGV